MPTISRRRRGVYYNECDPFAAEWLRQLMKTGSITNGEIDARPIQEVKVDDVKAYAQCHFFAGIGVWSYALERAGWGNEPIWTGSCPCQPFSAAGSRKGVKDERHLWPQWYRLIEECRPVAIAGEQVASSAGRDWFDIVSCNLESSDYTVGAVNTLAAGFGAPHLRKRLYFCAITAGGVGNSGKRRQLQAKGRNGGQARESGSADAGTVADAASTGLEGSAGSSLSQGGLRSAGHRRNVPEVGQLVGPFTQDPKGCGFWKECEWVACTDDKRRPIEPWTFPLVDGSAPAVGPRLRGYGNALCAPQAQAFVTAMKEVIHG